MGVKVLNVCNVQRKNVEKEKLSSPKFHEICAEVLLLSPGE